MHSTAYGDRGGLVTATFSMVARDPRTGWLGSAVASRYPAVGAVVPHFLPGVGVVNTQHWHDPNLAAQALALLQTGVAPERAMAMILAGDDKPALRQLLILDARGRAAVHTGGECTAAAKSVVGPDCAAAGNTLTGEDVVDAMLASFADHAADPLGLRLLKALQAGEQAGGDKRGKQAAAIRVVPPPGTGYSSAWCNWRVDDHAEPIAELFRIYELAPEPA